MCNDNKWRDLPSVGTAVVAWGYDGSPVGGVAVGYSISKYKLNICLISPLFFIVIKYLFSSSIVYKFS